MSKRKYPIDHINIVGGKRVASLTFYSWKAMRERVTNPYRDNAHIYEGMDFYEPWKDFNRFLEDMGERPSKEMTIDRIDNNKGYHPDNCRWADKKTQRANQNPLHSRGNIPYRGVGFDKARNKYKVEIHIKLDSIKWHTIYIGRYDCIIEAANAYDKIAKEWFGSKAILNNKKETK